MDRKLFDEIYKKIIDFWPVSIDVNFKHLSMYGGANIPALSIIHEKIEKNIEKVSEFNEDDIGHVDWALYTIIHNMAQKSSIVTIEKVNPDDVFQKVVDNIKILENFD